MSLPKLGKVLEFEWDKSNIAHIAKHDVVPKEAEEVFFDKDNVQDKDLEHSTIEKRFLVVGKTKKGRLLYQIFTIRGEKTRVISSRSVNKKEVKLYEKETGGS